MKMKAKPVTFLNIKKESVKHETGKEANHVVEVKEEIGKEANHVVEVKEETGKEANNVVEVKKEVKKEFVKTEVKEESVKKEVKEECVKTELKEETKCTDDEEVNEEENEQENEVTYEVIRKIKQTHDSVLKIDTLENKLVCRAWHPLPPNQRVDDFLERTKLKKEQEEKETDKEKSTFIPTHADEELIDVSAMTSNAIAAIMAGKVDV